MQRKFRPTLFGSCLPDRNNISAKALMLSIKDAPLATLKRTLNHKHLNARTKNGTTPVLAACKYGRVDVLTWLVTECEQSLYITDNNGNGPVEVAIKHGRHAIIKLLYLPTAAGGLGWTPQKTNALKNFPYDRDTALHAAPVSMMYFITDQQSTLDDLNNSSTHVMKFDLVTQQNQVFSFCDTIAMGSFGKISLYRTGEDAKLVKTPHSPVWQRFSTSEASRATFSNTYLLPESYNCVSYIKRIRREYRFTCLANPQYGPYTLQLLKRNQDGHDLYSYAFIMSEIPGSHPSLIFKLIVSPHLAAKLILRLIEAIHALHTEKNIIHGDIRDKNILVTTIRRDEDHEVDYEVVLIDFGFAYRTNKLAVPFVMPPNIEDKHVAPERINQIVDAHTSQDVWSIGTILREYAAANRELFYTVCAAFKSIELFITISDSADYRRRPTLADFINILKNEINQPDHKLRCSK